MCGGGRHNGNLCTFLSFLRGSKTALKSLTNGDTYYEPGTVTSFYRSLFSGSIILFTMPLVAQ